MQHWPRRGDLSTFIRLGDPWLTCQTSADVSTSWPLGVAGPRPKRPGKGTYLRKDSERLAGPPLPPGGTPTPTASLENLNERLERLAFPPAPTPGAERCPLETYTVTSEPNGDVYRATDEYIRWFRSRYPSARGGDRVQRPGSGGTAQEAGGSKRAEQDSASCSSKLSGFMT